MLESIFIELLNMSFIGSAVIIAVILLRMVMKKMPKKYSYYLWIVPLIRLTIPFSFKSIMSLIPVNPEPISQDIVYSSVPVIHPNTNPEVLLHDHLPEKGETNRTFGSFASATSSAPYLVFHGQQQQQLASVMEPCHLNSVVSG